MPIDSLPSLIEALRQQQLLTPAQWEELAPLLKGQPADHRVLARELVQRKWLTPFQINRLVQGRSHELTLGPYQLLELLGEGGMGQVLKGFHTMMKRTVAIKVIRGERQARPDSIRRFLREIEALSRLSHPNIVLAYDAAQVDTVLYVAMEYVEGTDLAKLVRQEGPLAPTRACDIIRQAALGLQHLHEHGLVHRDIKPSNLLRTATGGVVKLLDLGLARLGVAAEADETQALTVDGAIIGTPDYMAPEQATNTHTVDIRADIYSLGCTLHFLLAGKPPFPGGSVTQKLAAHLHAEPPSLEGLRADLPAGLAAVVLRMLAKRPEARFQTPAAVAVALAPFVGAGEAPTEMVEKEDAPVAAIPVAALPVDAMPVATSGDTVKQFQTVSQPGDLGGTTVLRPGVTSQPGSRAT